MAGPTERIKMPLNLLTRECQYVGQSSKKKVIERIRKKGKVDSFQLMNGRRWQDISAGRWW